MQPSSGVICLPWLDGERTPDAPWASGTVFGLKHRTSAESILQAAYEGVVATLVSAAQHLEPWAPTSPQAPLVLLGGGAKGAAWLGTVRRLTGRPVLVSNVAEPVAYGAAIQAAAALSGEPPRRVAQQWVTTRGELWEAVPQDEEILRAITRWQERVLPPL